MTHPSPKRFSSLVVVIFTLVASGCASVSRWQGLTASQLYDMGRSEFEAGKYDDAAETLERLVLGAPDFEQVADAQLMLARSYFNAEKFILAQAEYTRFLDRYRGHPEASEAALGVCRSSEALSPISQRDQTFTEQAVQLCRNVETDWQGTPAADEASRIVQQMRAKLAKKQYEGGAYYLRRGVPDAAILYWEELVASYPETKWAPAALAGIIDAYTQIGYEDEVEAARQRLVQGYPDSPEARAIGADGGAADGGG